MIFKIKSTHIQMIVILQSILLCFAVLSLTACAKKRTGFGNGEEIVGVGDTMTFYGSDLSPEQERELLNRNTYYFGYDSNELTDQDTLSIYAHAKKIMNRSRVRVRVEGHTDERGSREYNVALGERRAKAVANILMMKGVPESQISIVSYGKEKPSNEGHEESAWAQNRRAIIIYEAE